MGEYVVEKRRPLKLHIFGHIIGTFAHVRFKVTDTTKFDYWPTGNLIRFGFVYIRQLG